MPYVPVPNVAEVAIRGTLHGEQVQNTLHFYVGANPTPTLLANLGQAVMNWFTTGPRSILVSGYVLREAYVVDLASQNGPTATYTVVNDPGGPGTADPMPGNVALCVSFRTANRGRSFRGRNYISGFAENQVSANTIAPSVATTILSAYQGLNAAVTSLGAFHVIASRFHNGQPRVTGIATPVSSYVLVDAYVDSMRRRLPGRGR